MSVLKSLCIAFAMYSKIPVPQLAWKQEDMKYTLCFFPWVGAVIGALEVAWYELCGRIGLGRMAYAFVGAAIPIIVTGGFHIDGFMDTADARSSYQDRDKKLDILKDSHIGAFAVIRLLLYYLLYLAALSEVKGIETAIVFGIGFVLSRGMSGVAAVTMRSARNEGSLKKVSGAQAKRVVLVMLILQIALALLAMLMVSPWTGLLVVVGMIGCALYYRRMAYREFGGVTGDTAGYFLQLCELVIVIAAAAGGHII
ncbi:MAG: adenosylcobinamide-GDP ribazoletransferase [Butyrivibrio sp.]|nr:adenosylcobinamide-GDP ribazoletransferase [Muribaculum sp.]MCM1552107.1 adenosylcobinamide-GDP ribazoletransferase [Butyrivibrio sp.]